MEINQFQGITLYAFFEAVAQQTTPLPEDLKQKMSAVGEIFAQDTDADIDTAINQLAHLAQHPRLKPIYEVIRQKNQPDYQPQELYEHLPEPADPDKEPRNESIKYQGNVTVVINVSKVLKSSNPKHELDNNPGFLEKLHSLLFKKS